MPEYRISFGVKYSSTPHPFLPGVTGDHYVTVVADNAREARAITLNHIGRYFAFDYSEPAEGWDGHWTSKQCSEFARWDKDTPVTTRRVVSIYVTERTVRRREFKLDEICRLLDLETWEAERTDGPEFEVLIAMNDSMLSEMDGYEDSDGVTVEVDRDGPARSMVTLESL